MRTLSLLILLLSTGCAQTTSENAQSLFDRLAFGEGESGCVRLDATIDLNPAVIVTSNASIIYKKSKPDANGVAPEC